MATDVLPNRCVVVAVGTTLTELRTYATWLIVWSSKGNAVFLATGDLEEGGALPPFPIDFLPGANPDAMPPGSTSSLPAPAAFGRSGRSG